MLKRLIYLNLLPVSGGDIRYGPASLFFDGLFCRIKQWQKIVQHLAVEYHLSLRVVASYNITNSSQSCLHNTQRAMPKKTSPKIAYKVFSKIPQKLTYINSSTRRLHTLASITFWIFSFGPSDR
jgi:hypothetical protein